jgi:hypothetical protein
MRHMFSASNFSLRCTGRGILLDDSDLKHLITLNSTHMHDARGALSQKDIVVAGKSV